MALAGRTPPPKTQNFKQCGVSVIYEKLPPEEQEALRAMMGNKAWTHIAIQQALEEEGHGKLSIAQCRRNECTRCPDWGFVKGTE